MKRVAIYVRVSSQEQKLHGYSVDNQVEALKEYAANNNLYVHDIYNDAGISARKKYSKRPEVLRLIEDVKSNKIDMIIFTKLDRWFRSVADYYEVQTVLQKHNVTWKAIWEDYDNFTTEGVFRVNIMLSVAQQEADRTSDRVRAVKAYQRSKGHFMGSNPAKGYKRQGNDLVIDPEYEPYIRKFFDTYLSTFCTTKAIEAVENDMLLSRNAAIRILKNPTYYGDSYGCKCPAYITKEQHQKIIECIEGKRVRSGTTRTYLFSGMIICPECGKYLCSRYYKHEKYEYKMYHCPANADRRGCRYGANIYESQLESYLLSELDNIIDETNLTIDIRVKEQSNNEEEITKLKKRLKRLSNLYELGDMEDSEYMEKRGDILNKIENLKLKTTKKIDPLPNNWKEMYNKLNEENRKSFWRASIKNIRVYGKGKDKKYQVEF